MNTLLAEMITSLFAVGFLSLFVGWAIRSVLANKELKSVSAEMEKKQAELQLRYNQDTEHLETQVEKLEKERTQLSDQNLSITESLRENEIGVQKARADAIELNRQQADTQERLQRIIAQKDEELKMYRDGSAPALGAFSLTETETLDTATTDAKIASLSAKREAWEQERQRLLNSTGEEQQTIAIDPSDVPNDPFDSTVRMQSDSFDDIDNLTSAETSQFDIESDNTFNLDDDQTMALDNSKLHKPSLHQRRRDQFSDEDSLQGKPKKTDD